MDERTTFQWLGTAGFRIETGGRVLLIDPFFSRVPESRPVQPLGPGDMADAELIFPVSYTHLTLPTNREV